MHDPHELLPIAYRAAASVVRSPVLAAEAGERAIHQLTLAVLDGNAPLHPKAWLRVVARRSACALLRSDWARTRTVPQQDIEGQQAPWRRPRSTAADTVCERVDSRLSPRQRDALRAALSCNSTIAAARSCGMQPRDFRRYLREISTKARAVFEDQPTGDPFADDPRVQFELA